jgi:predicted RNA polymerase sigma factor
LLRERKPDRRGGARCDVESDRDADLRRREYLVVLRVDGVSIIEKRIGEGGQDIDPRISAQAHECTKPKQPMSRTNESEVLGKLMNSGAADAQALTTADAVARRSYGKLVAFLAARTRDVAAAEDALSEAFASALADWPLNGCPSNPEAWLLTVARRKTIDVVRRRRSGEIAAEQLQVMAEGLDAAATDAEIPDRRLALMFVCAHPAIDGGIRAPLMLQVVLGLDAKTIASAFLMSPAAMGKRLVRAKDKIRQAVIPFSVPEHEELHGRLDTVLDAIYAAFTEGWTDPGGTDIVRRDLTEEAFFLARLVTELLPEEPETLGLLALMLHAEARRRARRNVQGEYVPLGEQDSALWDSQKIFEAEALLRRASALGSIGRYQLEAALQSAHVYRCRTGQANWAQVVQLYDALFAIAGSPVVAINRALAIAEIDGARAALEALQEVSGDTRLAQYQPYWAARAELLAKAGAHGEACHAYEIAIGLERDPAVRRFLQQRQSALSA